MYSFACLYVRVKEHVCVCKPSLNRNTIPTHFFVIFFTSTLSCKKNVTAKFLRQLVSKYFTNVLLNRNKRKKMFYNFLPIELTLNNYERH